MILQGDNYFFNDNDTTPRKKILFWGHIIKNAIKISLQHTNMQMIIIKLIMSSVFTLFIVTTIRGTN
jgi:hypothetical protein